MNALDVQRLSLIPVGNDDPNLPPSAVADNTRPLVDDQEQLRHADSYGSLWTTYSEENGEGEEDLLRLRDKVSPLDGNDGNNNGNHVSEPENKELLMPVLTIVCILSTAFSYGCILTTLFMITLPLECERIHLSHPSIPTSVALGVFVAVAGVSQLVSPVVGRLSDTYVPPSLHDLGQRMPYLVLGSVFTVAGLMGQFVASFYGFWMRYSVSFFLHMIGLNVMYAMMIALIPDQIPRSQTGLANGVLALQLVGGSLFGFGLFHSFLYEQVQSMYGLYVVLVIVSTILTGTHAHDKDAELTFVRVMKRRRSSFRRVNRVVVADGAATSTAAVDGSETARDPAFPRVKPSTAKPIGAVVGEVSSHREEDDAVDDGVKRPAESTTTSRAERRRWHRVASRAARHAHHVIVLTPAVILRSVLVDPVRRMDWSELRRSYTIDAVLYHDFAVVTLSRLFYYCGMSVQTFFLYFVQDVVGVRDNPEAAVAALAIVGQVAGSLVPLPVGYWSDHLHVAPSSSEQARRLPFVYFACSILSSATLSLLLIRSLRQMTVACFVLGAANGMYLTMDTSLAVDTLPNEFEGDGGSAQLLGVWGVAAFLGATLGPMIGGPILYLVGAKVPDPSLPIPSREEYSLTGYAVLLALSSTYFLLSALTLRFLQPKYSSRALKGRDSIKHLETNNNQ
jgi:MFS family permease